MKVDSSLDEVKKKHIRITWRHRNT